MTYYTEEQQARLMALPGALLLLVLAVGESEPKTRLRDVIEDTHFVGEVKQAYPDNTLISGRVRGYPVSLAYDAPLIPFRERSSVACIAPVY